MYYYILEQPKHGSTSWLYNKLRSNLSFYGISGEISKISPVRNIEELAEIALAKQYSTIVAVGSDQLVNNLINYLQNKDCTLGIIPIGTSDLINNLIGTNDFKKACESLKERRVKTVSIGYILPDKHFLTKAEIFAPKPAIATIYFDKCNINFSFTKINIYSPSILSSTDDDRIYVNIQNASEGPNLITKTWDWLWDKKNNQNAKTYLRMKHLIIDTPEPLSVLLDGKIVGKTPIEIKVKPKVLKIITSRVKVYENNNK